MEVWGGLPPGKFWELYPLKLNLRAISAAYHYQLNILSDLDDCTMPTIRWSLRQNVQVASPSLPLSAVLIKWLHKLYSIEFYQFSKFKRSMQFPNQAGWVASHPITLPVSVPRLIDCVDLTASWPVHLWVICPNPVEFSAQVALKALLCYVVVWYARSSSSY